MEQGVEQIGAGDGGGGEERGAEDGMGGFEAAGLGEGVEEDGQGGEGEGGRMMEVEPVVEGEGEGGVGAEEEEEVEETEGGEGGGEGEELGPAGIDEMAVEDGDEVVVLAPGWRDCAVGDGERGRARGGGRGGEVADGTEPVFHRKVVPLIAVRNGDAIPQTRKGKEIRQAQLVFERCCIRGMLLQIADWDVSYW